MEQKLGRGINALFDGYIECKTEICNVIPKYKKDNVSINKNNNQKYNNGTPIEQNIDTETLEIADRISKAIRVETKLKRTKKGGVFILTCKSCEELESLIVKLISLEDYKE